MKIPAVALLLLVIPLAGFAEEKKSTAKERELIEAVYRLRVKDVERLLAEGADVNVRYGKHEADDLFQDPWDLGYPMAYPIWTPLLALSAASVWPPPPRKIENTEEDFEFRLSLEDPNPQVENGSGLTRTPDLILTSRFYLKQRLHLKASLLGRQIRAQNISTDFSGVEKKIAWGLSLQRPI